MSSSASHLPRRYGSSTAHPVFSRLQSQALPSVDGITSWLAVSTALHTTSYHDAGKPVLRLQATTAGGGVVEGGEVELLQVEVVVSHRDVFGATSSQGRAGRSQSRRRGGSARRRTEQHGLRRASRSHSPGMGQRSRSPSPARQRTPPPPSQRGGHNSRGSSPVFTRLVASDPPTFAVREMQQGSSGELRSRAVGQQGEGMDIAEEAEVHAFLSRYLGREARDRLMRDRSVHNMYAVLGLDEEALLAAGLADEEERRCLLDGESVRVGGTQDCWAV